MRTLKNWWGVVLRHEALQLLFYLPYVVLVVVCMSNQSDSTFSWCIFTYLTYVWVIGIA